MTEQQHFPATKQISAWLARGGLTLDSLQKLPTSQQAAIGRSWSAYQRDVKQWQERWQCSDAEILRAEVPSYHATPRTDGSLKPKADLDKLNHPSLY